jgi:hypothetical protein
MRARSADHQVVAAHRVLQPPREVLQLPLEPLVLERRHPSAQLTDGVVMVLAPRDHRLVAGTTLAELDALDEAELMQEVEGAVDARDADVVA